MSAGSLSEGGIATGPKVTRKPPPRRPLPWFWNDDDRANAKNYDVETFASGFRVINARQFPNRDIKGFEKLVSAKRSSPNGRALDDEWRALDDRVNQYFATPLQPFPYDRGRAAKVAVPLGPEAATIRDAQIVDAFVDDFDQGQSDIAKISEVADTDELLATDGELVAPQRPDNVTSGDDRWPRRLLTRIAGFRMPAAFYRVQLETIEARFGATATAKDRAMDTDADVRGYVALLRLVFGENLWLLILKRRQNAAIASLLVVIAYGLLLWSFTRGGTSSDEYLPWFDAIFGERAQAIDAWITTTFGQSAGYGPQIVAVLVSMVCIAFVVLWIGAYADLRDHYRQALLASVPYVAVTVLRRTAQFRSPTHKSASRCVSQRA